MYARYIPPSGGQKPLRNNEDSSAAKQSPAPSAATTTNVDGLSYSRYIPGAKTTQQDALPIIQRFDDESNSATPKRKRSEEEQLPVSENTKSKKSKKEKQNDDSEEAESKSKRKRVKDLEKGEKKKKDKKKRDVPDDEDDEPTSNGSISHQQEADVDGDDNSVHDEESDMVHEAESDPEASEPAEKQKKPPKREKKKKSQDAEMEEAQEEEEDKRHKAVFERKAKSLKYSDMIKEQGIVEEPEEPAELHGLEPLPQPEPAAPSTAKPTYETLPPWLAAPIRVSQDTRTSFADLGILPKAARFLEQKGYTEAFAVQTAALPLLLPTNKQPGDLLVSAATGSGKTLAYALPIVRDLSNSVVTRLRCLVVLPTRELVKQAQEVFELCAKAYEGEDRKRVRVGIAIGNQSLASEQDILVTKETRYDPEAYKQLEEEASSYRSSEEDLDELLTSSDTRRTDPRIGPWQGQVIDFHSKVDILICTPGRLVEHIDQTPGFTLSYIRWLVVDEADKLLAQSFQGWLDVVLDKFKVSHYGARDFPDMPYSGVRKILLSATLTRDLSLLNQLALKRPKLIVLESGSDVQVAEHSLPELLREYAVRVHDANLKPLYLLDLLRSRHMAIDNDATKSDKAATDEQSDSASETSSDDSSSSSDSDSDSDDSDTSSDSDSDSDSDADSKSKEKRPPSSLSNTQIPRALIFTKSNEAALRLSRLLTILDKSLATQISTLTSTTPTSIRRKTLRAFTTPSSPLRLIIASDLVARGIDIPKLPHVINYDLPPSVAGYVHRVGRTARAGRSGCAWTLVGDGESGWFWGKIGKGAGVKRAQKVDRVMIEEMNEDRIEEYESALEKLGKEALESRKR
ncbi:P-loop containing nucleoside triphosphate hydrolase protein [Trichoderma sp. SZMC 28014]